MGERFYGENISKVRNKRIFFDANILIYLYWPTNYKWEKEYSKIYKNLLKQNNKFFVDFNIISEIVNRAIRIQYQSYLNFYNQEQNDFSFKQYRNSKDGQEVIKDIYEIIKSEILNIFNLKGKLLDKNDIENLLEVDSLDFNDKYIKFLCEQENFILLTNDLDFKDSDLDILTANKNLQ